MGTVWVWKGRRDCRLCFWFWKTNTNTRWKKVEEKSLFGREARTEKNRKKSRADDSSLVVRFGPIASSLFSLFALLCWWNEAHSAGVSFQEETWEVLQAPLGLGSVPQEPSIASLPFQEATQQDWSFLTYWLRKIRFGAYCIMQCFCRWHMIYIMGWWAFLI